MVAQNRMGEKNRGTGISEGQETYGGHSWLQLKAIGGGEANNHVLDMKQSVAAPVTREAKAKLE